MSKIFTFLIIALVLAVSLRGHVGNPNSEDLNTRKWKEEGPFELSVERGRFAIVYSLLEDQSFSFSVPVARFALPDLGYKNEKYVSLFAPGLSFLAFPGYLVGRFFGLAQIGAYATISLFALLNSILIYAISYRLTRNKPAGLFVALVYIFATPAFAYAVSFYQHQVSTFLILMSFWALLYLGKRPVLSAGLILFLAALSIPIDYPNLFLLFPAGLLAVSRLFSVSLSSQILRLKINPRLIFIPLAVVPALLFFFWFNNNSYANPLQFSGTIDSVKLIDSHGRPARPQARDISTEPSATVGDKSALLFFNPRSLLNSLTVHFFSPDRGLVIFTPIILLGVLGVVILYSQNHSIYPALVATVLVNVTLYSLWDDPWGGWAFGSRYLIPSYALMSVFIAVFLSNWRRNLLAPLIVLPLFIYSVGVNTLGALTSNSNPPKAEAKALESISGREEKYTYFRNWDLLEENHSKSLIYSELFSSQLSAVQYWAAITGIISLSGLLLLVNNYRLKKI